MAIWDQLVDIFDFGQETSGEKSQKEDEALRALIDSGIYQKLAGSEFSNISEDPRLKAAQMKALAGLQDVYNQGGLTAQDRARIAQINEQINQQEQAQRNAILQNARARGTAGSGLEYAQQLAAQQQGANTRAMQGVNTAAEANRRALEALQQSGQLGGQIRGQEYGMASDKARALDEIARFNANATSQNQASRAQYAQGNRDYLRNKQAQSEKSFWDTLGTGLGMAGQIGSRFLNPAGGGQQRGGTDWNSYENSYTNSIMNDPEEMKKWRK